MFEKIELRKTRDFSAKISVTFEFLRQNLGIMAKSLIYISGPIILIQGVFMGMYQQKVLSLGQPQAGIFGNWVGELAVWIGAALVFSSFAYVSTLIVVNEFVRLYEEREDPRTIQVADVWEGVKENFIPVFVAGILVILMTGVATLLLLLPGIYVGVTLTLVGPILIIEKKSIGDAVSRSFSLITDKWWSTFGLIIVMSMIAGTMGFVFQLPQTVITFLSAFHKASDGVAEVAPWEKIGVMVSTVISTIASNLLQSMVVLALIFQYFNLVERREAKGLLHKLESFGKTDANAPRHDETY